MKKTLLVLSTIALLSSTSFAATQNIAVVDLLAVISQSAQVTTLKNEQKNKIEELNKWLKTAQEDVDKQQTKEGKDKLIKKYNAEFTKKRDAMAKDYKAKLDNIDKTLTEVITNKAKAMGYDMVISKSSVVMGGDDITAEIQKLVK